MKKTLLLCLAVGLAITGCKNEVTDITNNTAGTAVSFTSSIIKSRAIDNNWEAGDEIGVYMQNADAATSYLNTNVKYTNSDENTNGFTSETPITYPGGDVTLVNFMAVYPYNENVTDGNYSFTLGDNLSDNDIMYASSPLVEAGTNNVDLTFKHKLSKIVLNIKDENGNPLNDATVSIDKQCKEGVLNMSDGTVTAKEAAEYNSSLQFVNKTNGQYEAIVLPDEAREGRIILVKTSDNKIYRCPIDNISFDSSKRYTFPVVLYSKDPSVEQPGLVPDIDNWTDEGKSEGWVVAPGVDITTSKTQYVLIEEQTLTTNSTITVSEENFSGTLVETDAYCIEYSRADASTAATLTVSSSAKGSKAFTLPENMEEGKVIFAVGEFTTGINISSDVDITLKSVSVYSVNIITPIVPIVIWEGEHNFGSWTGTSIEYKPEFLTETTEGSTLRFFYKDKTDNAQLQFAGQATIDVTDDLGYVDMKVTSDLILSLTSNSWPWMSGQNMTITKILLLPAPTE